MQNKDYSNRIGEESNATNGMKIKISEYFSSSNVTVVFEYVKGTVKSTVQSMV